jgi:glycosidase
MTGESTPPGAPGSASPAPAPPAPPPALPPRPAARSRRPLLIGTVLLVVIIGIAGLILRPNAFGPTESPHPSGPIAVADKTPLAPDGKIEAGDLAHNSRLDTYRTPFGAVPAETQVILRLRSAAGDLTEATVRVWDQVDELQALLPMDLVATDPTQGDHGYDYWQITLHTTAKPTILWYRFIVRDGTATAYLEDDPADDGGAVAEGSDGGAGRVYDASIDASWQIDVYDPAFTTPDWAKGAVAYQIFPDRFFDGDPSNNPTPSAVQGIDGADVFRYGDVYGNPVLVKHWDERPEGYCRAYQGVACGEGPLGRDFYGGDLAGVTAKLDDLQALGVTVIYLNPIFAAPSNHRYDTSSYAYVDPDLGSQADFDTLVREAESRGMRVLLDGVFNHVSSDSPWFDRARRFEEVGACESPDSVYRAWFTFRAPNQNEPAPCAPSTPGGDDTYYNGWFGFDTIPEVLEQGAVYDLFTGEDGIVQRWIAAGTGGWRLDVMDNLSHKFMRLIRAAAKAADPDALVLGEKWDDASIFLLGDQADSTMNYRFRRAVIGLINGDTADLDGAIVGLTPSQFAERMLGVMEDYPAPAWETLLNLVDSHDTTRILWTLAPGQDNPADKESAAGLAEARTKVRLVAAIQLTWPGIASIYYGTEAGLTGHDDPDDRRPYPWDSIDTELQDWYRALGTLRGEHEALRTGDLEFLVADDDNGGLAYLRGTADEVAITVLNLATKAQTISVPVDGRIPDGTILTDGLSGVEATVNGGSISVELAARDAAVYVTPAGTDLAAPVAPAQLVATADGGAVELAWAPVADAAGYQVWRSILTKGGYELVGTAATPAFTDSTARNGTRSYYVVVAVDAAGNASARSNEVNVLPQLHIVDARLAGPAEVSQPLSAIDPGVTIEALVFAGSATTTPGPTIGIRAQLGFGQARPGDPATTYAWSEMAWVADAGDADRLGGTVRPEALGTYNVVLRVSTDGGATWSYADRGGIVAGPDGTWGYRPDQAVTLGVTENPDAQAPPAPGNLRVTTAGDASVTLAWDAVNAPDLFRYEISRAGTPGGPYEPVGTSLEPSFTDASIRAGDSYVYVVTAVDTAFNRSGPSSEVAAAAVSREVQVTFTVTLPASTPPGDTIYIAGDFQGWDPAKTPMTKVDDQTWTITVAFTEGVAPQYKYTRGSWEAVEKDAGCGEIPNRTFNVTFGDAGALAIADTVEKWRDADQCG